MVARDVLSDCCRPLETLEYSRREICTGADLLFQEGIGFFIRLRIVRSRTQQELLLLHVGQQAMAEASFKISPRKTELEPVLYGGNVETDTRGERVVLQLRRYVLQATRFGEGLWQQVPIQNDEGKAERSPQTVYIFRLPHQAVETFVVSIEMIWVHTSRKKLLPIGHTIIAAARVAQNKSIIMGCRVSEVVICSTDIVGIEIDPRWISIIVER